MREIPRATVGRLARYLQGLEELGRRTVSSADIASAVGVSAAQVRRDLSYLGHQGIRGVGYETSHLLTALRRELGLVDRVGVAIVGAGNLGQALAGYGGFEHRGFVVSGIYDIDQDKVGTSIHGHQVRHLGRLSADAADRLFAIAIIATPADAAPEVLQRLAAGGVRSVLNFSPTVLKAPATMEVRNVDLSTELQILSFYRGRPPNGALPGD
ncbi:MAG: redox-sensing transcriptional repressor Rex [Acidimicrobiia bacterium]